MATPHHTVEILNSSKAPLTQLNAFYPLDSTKAYLRYTTKLSDYGKARFRIKTQDRVWATYGDIFKPYVNHVRIYRDGVQVWQGIIVNNPQRTKDFVEVEAYEYLYLLNKVLIRHEPADGQGAENFRTFKSGTMASAITSLISDAAADGGALLSGMTAGTITNPNFPPSYTDFQNNNIGGQAWAFSDNFYIKFDYRSVLYVLTQFATYVGFDISMDSSYVVTFSRRIGADKPSLVFSYSTWGNLSDFNAPKDGGNMANAITGVAADNQYNIIHLEQTDQASIATYGKLAAVAAFNDVKNTDLLRSRLTEELRLSSVPDAEVQLFPNDKAYPYGEYVVGDSVTVDIDYYGIETNVLRRIVAYENSVLPSGYEQIRLIGNVPRTQTN